MDDNVISLVPRVPEEPQEGIVKITYLDSNVDLVEADQFAYTEDLPGFIAFWKDNPYILLGFFNSSQIRKIELVAKDNG